MASTSFFSSSSHLPIKEPESTFQPYPEPLARYEDVISDPNLFISTLKSLHLAMKTKFMTPIIGGKDLDLYKLFLEVTSRGGIEKVIREKRWKEVTTAFNFPSSATNASFVLRKYYFSLLYHYEQIYLFKARGWIPSSDAVQTSVTTPAKAQGTTMLPTPQIKSTTVHQPMMSSAELPKDAVQSSVTTPANAQGQSMLPTPQLKSTTVYQPMMNTAQLSGAKPALSAANSVIGVIDGKFDSGYLVTVTIGSEKLKGVLYQAPLSVTQQAPQTFGIVKNTPVVPGVRRRRRRKKSEIKRRDPAHPKPNRSGYNFFFAEQHARLKLLNPGKDREISRMIGELWNNLNETDKAVYQEKAIKDKERYRIEMEEYRETLRTDEVVSDAVPLRQKLPEPELNLMDVNIKFQEDEIGDTVSQGDGTTGSSESEMDRTEDLDMEASPDAGDGIECSNMDVETSLTEEVDQNEKDKKESNENAGNN